MLRLAAAGLALWSTPNHCRAQDAEDLDDEVRPAPPSIGADVPLAYFGPAPSSVDKRLVGPVQLLNAGVIDEDLGTIQLPLYTGYYKGGECLFRGCIVRGRILCVRTYVHHLSAWFFLLTGG